MQNPYTLTFGKEPIEYIKRIAEERQILEDFLSPNPPQQVYMISGVRGCGKTVFMTDISQEIGRDEDWIVVDLNPFIWIWSGSIRCGTDCGYSGRFGTDD